MNIVLLVTKYTNDINNPYLTDELACELVRCGHRVTVLLTDWDRAHGKVPNIQSGQKGIQLVISQPVVISWLPKTLQLTIKWLVSPLISALKARQILRLEKPELAIAISPLVAIYGPSFLLTSKSIRRRFLIQFDFFPDAQAQLGMLTGALKIRSLRAIENYLMRRFTHIGCLSPANISYLSNNYKIPKNIDIVHLPLWSSCPTYLKESKSEVRMRLGIPLKSVVFVFGGQLVAGRGIGDVLAAARLLSISRPDFIFLFVGNGPLSKDVEAEIQSGFSNVMLLSGVKRSEYLKLLDACDVGIVCTVRNVTVPTFPSKTLDYLLTNLPILASVEASTDYGEFIENFGVGVSVLAGDLQSFIDSAIKISDTHHFSVENFANCLSAAFNIRNACNIICGDIDLKTALSSPHLRNIA